MARLHGPVVVSVRDAGGVEIARAALDHTRAHVVVGELDGTEEGGRLVTGGVTIPGVPAFDPDVLIASLLRRPHRWVGERLVADLDGVVVEVGPAG